jgi:hypothetical protein
VEHATISVWDATVPRLGAPQTFVFNRLASPVQDRLSTTHLVSRHKSSKIAGPLGRKGRPIREGGIYLQQPRERQRRTLLK